jgi:hypothetical protein
MTKVSAFVFIRCRRHPLLNAALFRDGLSQLNSPSPSLAPPAPTMSLLALVNETKPLDPQSFLQAHLVPFAPSDQLHSILAFLASVNKVDETLAHTMSQAWIYLINNSLWTSTTYSSLNQLCAEIDFDSTLLLFLQRSQNVSKKPITLSFTATLPSPN